MDDFVDVGRTKEEEDCKETVFLESCGDAASGPRRGCIHVTNYHVTFASKCDELRIKVPLMMIKKVSFCPDPSSIDVLSSYTRLGRSSGASIEGNLSLECRNFRTFVFSSAPEKVKDKICDEMRKGLKYAFEKYALESSSDLPPRNPNGWTQFSMEKEYERQELPLNDAVSEWRLYDNRTQRLCETYPHHFAIPRSVENDTMESAAKFRSKNRVPALTWYNKHNKAVICRCSQPKTGAWVLVGMASRNKNDENLVECIRNASGSKSHKPDLLIVDCRSYNAALANIARGKGTEVEDHYPNCDIRYMDIENIHAMRESYEQLYQVTSKPANPRWTSDVSTTNWKYHVSSVLVATVEVVEAISHGQSVLIHCSDGWDRTSQVASLSQLLLDPYFRTIRGFQDLIEKDWLHFGHKFEDRVYSTGEDRSPVFQQWIDCVALLSRHFREAFEFNEKYLIEILDALYSGYYGTFFCCSKREREKENLSRVTQSLWDHLNALKDVKNPFYRSTMRFRADNDDGRDDLDGDDDGRDDLDGDDDGRDDLDGDDDGRDDLDGDDDDHDGEPLIITRDILKHLDLLWRGYYLRFFSPKVGGAEDDPVKKLALKYQRQIEWLKQRCASLQAGNTMLQERLSTTRVIGSRSAGSTREVDASGNPVVDLESAKHMRVTGGEGRALELVTQLDEVALSPEKFIRSRRPVIIDDYVSDMHDDTWSNSSSSILMHAGFIDGNDGTAPSVVDEWLSVAAHQGNVTLRVATDGFYQFCKYAVEVVARTYGEVSPPDEGASPPASPPSCIVDGEEFFVITKDSSRQRVAMRLAPLDDAVATSTSSSSTTSSTAAAAAAKKGERTSAEPHKGECDQEEVLIGGLGRGGAHVEPFPSKQKNTDQNPFFDF